MPSKTTVTATIQNAAGDLASSGYVEFTLQPKNASALFYVLGTAVLAPQTVRAVINASGLLKASDGTSALQLWGNDTLQPSGTWYKAKFVPDGHVTNTVDLLLISGTTYDLATPVIYEPGIVEPNRQTPHFQAIESDIIPAADGVFWLGSAAKRYAAAYINQLFTLAATITSLIVTTLTVTTAAITSLTASVLSVASITNNTGLASGEYIPVLTNTLNVAASTAYVCRWIRVGNIVTIAFRFDIDPTVAAPTATEMQFTPPIASNFADSANAAGSGVFGAVPGQAASILADAATDRLSLSYFATNAANAAITGVCSYTIL